MIVWSVVVAMASAALSWSLLFFLIPLLQSSLPDAPNARSAHQRVTPRGGGLAFVIVTAFVSMFYAGSSVELGWLALIALPLAALGLADDRLNLPASLRYLFQLLTAVFVVMSTPMPLAMVWLTVPLLVIGITAVINFTNFMDGLDGLVAGCMGLVMTAAAIQLSAPLSVWALVGSLFGFLFWNWSPAKVFMGDVGSTFLGVIFATMVLQSSTWLEAIALLLTATPIIGDASFCVVRRLMAGQRVFQAHRLHLFQRLHQAGWPHARVSSLFIAATAVLVVALLWGGLPWVLTLVALELLFGIWLDQRVAVPFAVASRS